MLQFPEAACRLLPAYLLQASAIQFAAKSLAHTRHYHSGAPAWSCTATERERLCCRAAPKAFCSTFVFIMAERCNAGEAQNSSNTKNERFWETSRNQGNQWPTIDIFWTMLVLIQDLRHPANLLWACVFCCHISKKAIFMPFQDPPTKRLHLVFLEHVLLQSVRFFGMCPRSLSFLVWRLLQCSTTVRFLAECPRSVLVLSWQSQLCFSLPDCTSNSPESTCMFFARTSNSVDISFGLFFFVSNSQWCPASSSDGKKMFP